MYLKAMRLVKQLIKRLTPTVDASTMQDDNNTMKAGINAEPKITKATPKLAPELDLVHRSC
jgi:hypothetical protein